MIRNKDLKIGVLTHYFNSNNYGGLLQAFSLVQFLSNNGYNSEQICYKFKNEIIAFDMSIETDLLEVNKKANNKISKKIIRFCTFFIRRRNAQKLNHRKEVLRHFRDNIRHSSNTFDKNNVKNLNNIYNCFIVGSDQVWNFEFFSPVFFLEFCHKSSNKISYSASMCVKTFTENQKKYLLKTLNLFNHISVREKNACLLLNENILHNKKAIVTLDPVFLIEDEWNNIMSDRNIKYKYIFCYFLSPKKDILEKVSKIAKKYKFKIVCIPYLSGTFNAFEFRFNAKKVIDASPFDFVNMVKYASGVFTDSFHATAFSAMFNIPFFTFIKKDKSTMSERILSICDIFDCQKNIVNDLNDLDESTISFDKKNYNRKKYLEELNKSKEWLLKSISDL